MKRQATIPGILLLVLIVTVIVLAGCAKKSSDLSPVDRGKYLVMVGGCGDCHSPKVFTAAGPVPDTARTLSGYPSSARLPEIPKGILSPAQWGALTTNDQTAWVGPWGVSFASNLTPHPAAGIGNWTEALFIQILRTGKFMGTSRDILPPMPWQEMGKMTDEDLKAVFTYLKSLPPIDNAVPVPLPPGQQ
jgi:mono/diheme cytochrome c family protein